MKKQIDIVKIIDNMLTKSQNQFCKDMGLGPTCYTALTKEDSREAWKSIQTWIEEDSKKAWSILTTWSECDDSKKIFNSEYFCAIGNTDLTHKILTPATGRASDECFIMLRLSQNVRPLVFVCVFGGLSSVTQVRIGLSLIFTNSSEAVRNPKNPRELKLTIEFTVINKDKKITHSNSDIDVIIQELIKEYSDGRKVLKWSVLKQ